jgi:hypothetical protein
MANPHTEACPQHSQLLAAASLPSDHAVVVSDTHPDTELTGQHANNDHLLRGTHSYVSSPWCSWHISEITPCTLARLHGLRSTRSTASPVAERLASNTQGIPCVSIDWSSASIHTWHGPTVTELEGALKRSSVQAVTVAA